MDTVHVRVAGYLPLECVVPDEAEELVVEMKPGIPFRGRVRLADGSPACGARVRCWSADGYLELDVPQTTDAEGRFTIAAVEKAKPFKIVVAFEGHAPAALKRILLREEAEGTIRLGARGTIEGVTIPDAEVYVRAAQAPNPLQLKGWQENDRDRIAMETACARADRHGRYRVAGLAVPGAYVVCVGTVESSVVELSVDRPSRTVDLAETAPHLRRVRIVDEHGAPVADGWVWPVGRQDRALKTSGDGVVELPAAVRRIEVDGYASALVTQEVRLSRGIVMHGCVAYADGTPAVGQSVIFGQPLGRARYRAHSSKADHAGRFRIPGLEEGTAWLTAGRVPESQSDGLLEIRAAMEDVRITLPIPARIAGRVLPVPETLRCPRSGQEVELQRDGSFLVDGVPSGRPFVFDLRPGDTILQFPHARLRAGTTVNVGLLRLDAEATIAGVVRNDAGEPVGGSQVHVAVGTPYEPTYTDAQGRFALKVRPVAPVKLEVQAAGYAARYLDVSASRFVNAALDRGGLVRGRVIGAFGKGFAGAYIVFWRRLANGQLAPYEDWKPEVDSVGRFEIRMPPGQYHLRFYDMGRSHARIPGPEVDVRLGATTELVVRLP
jgi:protocatechuate 3,4-dioxygenase beta subunit